MTLLDTAQHASLLESVCWDMHRSCKHGYCTLHILQKVASSHGATAFVDAASMLVQSMCSVDTILSLVYSTAHNVV